MTTPIFLLTEWGAAQEQPWIAHNLALRLIEALIRGTIEDRDLTAPPVSCADGDAFLVDSPATGLWATHEGEFAVALGEDAASGWAFANVEREGYVLYVADEDIRIEWRTDLSPPGWQEVNTGGVTVDNDTTLASDSTVNPPSVHAVRGYVATAVTGLWELKGNTDCSGNPNYPAASAGDAYVVSVAGKIGGASGANVDVGDVFVATADNAGGTQAGVGSSWVILEHNIPTVTAYTDAMARAAVAIAPTVEAGTSFTPSLGDEGAYFQFTSGSAVTFTVPANASEAFAIGTVMTIEQNGAGTVTITPDGGVTLRSRGGLLDTAGQYAVAQIKKVATNTWTVIGDVA